MTEYYKEKLEQGLAYQDFVVEQLYKHGLPLIAYSSKKYQNEIGENKAGFEIKFDNNILKYGNIYFETAEKSNSNNLQFIPSGIFRNDNTWLYVIGDYDNIYILSKKQLKKIYENIDCYKDKGILKKEILTSQGMVIPLKYAKVFLIIKHINCLED
jgi:hypothetical protein